MRLSGSLRTPAEIRLFFKEEAYGWELEVVGLLPGTVCAREGSGMELKLIVGLVTIVFFAIMLAMALSPLMPDESELVNR